MTNRIVSAVALLLTFVLGAFTGSFWRVDPVDIVCDANSEVEITVPVEYPVWQLRCDTHHRVITID